MASRLSVGRVRVTRAVSPTEAGYIQHMRAQMRGIASQLQRHIDKIKRATPGAVRYAVQPIFDESQRLVPVDTQTLKNSGFVEVRTRSGSVMAIVGYAKGGTPGYAVFVHERTDLNHDAPTQAKFLQAAAEKHMGDIVPRAAEFIKRRAGSR